MMETAEFSLGLGKGFEGVEGGEGDKGTRGQGDKENILMQNLKPRIL